MLCGREKGDTKKKIPADWVRTVKKHMDRLKAADKFEDFLELNLGHPESPKGEDAGKYSVRITGNVRLIMKPNEKGVCKASAKSC